MLDGKEVNEGTRLFLQSWQANKELKKTKRKQKLSEQEEPIFADDHLPNIALTHTNETSSGYAVPPVGAYAKQNKRFTALLAKASERKDVPLNPSGEISTR